MKHFVERTCTVVRGHEDERGGAAESGRRGETGSHPLEAFREVAAYVLLGAPGAGKTEAFRREACKPGGHYVTARDFLTFDPEPDWQGKTLFIDGLDEVRAGASGGRTPFDAIRTKLQRLGRPPFRLSCRAADWFGANDRERLSAVAPNREVLVLRLDPLSETGVLEILERNHDVHDPAAFVTEARRRGVEDLLLNPQNLRMLVEAVAETDGEWPRTRTETFHMACRKLVSEDNPEHQIACGGTFSTKALLDGAGDLCALVLLTGKSGVTLPGTRPDPNHPPLDRFPGEDTELLQRVVGTNLFDMHYEGRLAPVHRQIAEFLAARRLAARIADGLPIRRVLSLMTGFDGGVISEFRGLAAWLAAHSTEARAAIVERDPLGVVLYGDVRQFTRPDKKLILRALKAETDGNPWLIGDTNLHTPLGSLVDADLEDDFRRTLADPARHEAHQSFVFMILQAVRAGPPLPGLSQALLVLVRDDSWHMTIRCTALEAYIRASRHRTERSKELGRLLEDVYDGVVATRNDDLLGTLLMELYPDDLSVPDLVGYLREPARRNLWTRYGVFWTDHLIKASTIEQMVQLLDCLKAPMGQVRSESGDAPWGVDLVARPPIILLRHVLEHSPESVPREQLFHWLEFAGWLSWELEFSLRGVVGDAEFFRNWLSNRPDIQKAIIKDAVSRCQAKEDRSFVCMDNVKRSLFRATPPEDYGTWCADHALCAENDEIADWFAWESARAVHQTGEPETQQRESIAQQLRTDTRLAGVFADRLAILEAGDRFEEGMQRTPQARPTPNDGRFDELRGLVKANVLALHANQCPPNLLHHLARAYLNDFSDVHGETPQDRLRFLLGRNDGLHAAALAGLRGAIGREDLPTDTDILRLTVQGQLHPLAYPFMVGLEELFKHTETNDFHLDEAQNRLAVAIHFAVWRLPHSARLGHPPGWLQVLLAQDPDTVAEVWGRCVRARLQQGDVVLPDAYELAHKPDFAPLAQVAAVRLLQSFPVRCKAGQLPIVSSWLQAACLHADRRQFLELIETKLSYRSMNTGQRVYWLVAGLFVSPADYADRLESYVSGKERRIQRVAEISVDTHAVPQALMDRWDVTVIEKLIRLIGPYCVPPPSAGEGYRMTWPIQAYLSLHGLIDRLADDASAPAGSALESLAADDRLVDWKSKLLDRLHQQQTVNREANFTHPSLEQVAEILDNGRPAKAADLWALTIDLLHRFSRRIRDGATTDWRQYWNVDQYNRAENPKPEDAGRDALLSDLEQALTPLGVEGVKEGYYADDKRSDIRLSVPGYNIPVEIKRSCHDDWCSSIRTQLIDQYTRDPGTDGYGIYLVLWFGEAEGCRPTPASGRRPKSPRDVRRALVESLTDLERRKISVIVIDVSKPET